MIKVLLATAGLALVGAFVFLETYTPAISKAHGNVQAKLFVGAGDNQPLIVGFGGAEGGNAWASDRWKETRDGLVEQGYAVLAIGYFGMEATPGDLDRISLNAIYDSIMATAGHPSVDKRKIALIGGRRERSSR
jgi:hypothetical protein